MGRYFGMTAGRNVKSKNVDWCTPCQYVDAVRRVFGGNIALDPCSNEWSVVDADTEYRLPERDGLSETWNYPTVYVNPPYGSDRERRTTIKDWLKRCAYTHKQHGSRIIALVPVATNTGHWKKYIWGQAAAICFLYDTRLRFLVQGKNAGKGAPMSCAMVSWDSNINDFGNVFCAFGAVVDIRALQREITTFKLL